MMLSRLVDSSVDLLFVVLSVSLTRNASSSSPLQGPGRRRPELLIGSRSAWTAKEDALVTQLVAEHGAHNWVELAKHVKGRVGKQCRERWNNHLSPDVSKAAWTANEEAELMRLHGVHGNKWTEIAARMPVRPHGNACVLLRHSVVSSVLSVMACR